MDDRLVPEAVARRRRPRRILRGVAVLAALAAVLAAAGCGVLSQPQFGAPMTGARLERAKANPQYRDGRFVNLQPETPTSFGAIVGYIVRQFSGDEVRVPPAPLPVLAVDKAALAAAPPASGLRAFWIGHASVYVEIDGLRLLLDPVFAERVSPLLDRAEAIPSAADRAGRPAADRRRARLARPLRPSRHGDRARAGRARHALLRAARHRRAPRALGRAAGADRGDGMVAAARRSAASSSSARRRATTPGAASAIAARRCGRAGRCSARSIASSTAATPATRTHFQEIGSRLGPFDIAFVKIGAYGPGAVVDRHPHAARAVGAGAARRAREADVPGPLVDLQPRVPRLGRADPPHRRRSAPHRRRAGDAAGSASGSMRTARSRRRRGGKAVR